jgi:hypothetical protein
MPIKKSTLLISGNTVIQDEPSVKYCRIFLNDAPALSIFVRQFGNVNTEGFPGFNYNFYTKLFDLILRLKGN